MKVPFNLPAHAHKQREYLEQALNNSRWSGEGPFNQSCVNLLQNQMQAPLVVMTPSCTAALEMAMVMIGIGPGDEVIMPSFTFTSTANAVVLFGGTPVFVDISPDTMNLNPDLVEKAITPKTKAIIPVHYAGVGCEMDSLMEMARQASQNHKNQKKIWVIEDAAQGIGAKWREKPLGSLGHLGAISFHDTKNITCGEGGALVVNDPELLSIAEMVRDKGTNRQQFLNRQVDKYTWQMKGGSYLLSEFSAAVLLAQLEEVENINNRRKKIWNFYHESIISLEEKNIIIRQPKLPKEADFNAHIYYFHLVYPERRAELICEMNQMDVFPTSHYVPLHSAPAGLSYGRLGSSMDVTQIKANSLIRLPLFTSITQEQAQYTVDVLLRASSIRS